MSHLMPPMEVWIIEIIAISALLIIVNSQTSFNKTKQVFLWALLISLLLTIGLGLGFGFGPYLGWLRVIGKFIAHLIAFGFPIFLVATTFVICQRLKFGRILTNVISILFGLLGIIPLINIGVVLVCILVWGCV